MTGVTAVGGVGAGLSEARFQAELQVQALKRQQEVVENVGAAVLDLIQRALSFEPQQYDLDVRA